MLNGLILEQGFTSFLGYKLSGPLLARIDNVIPESDYFRASSQEIVALFVGCLCH